MPLSKNIVLVHGAWADGSCWAKVIPRLQAAGFYVTAVQMPLSSLKDDVAVVDHALATQKGPVTLVGHSYGGLVITNVTAVASVTSLVYLAAFALDEGESIEALSKSGPATPGSAHIRPDDFGRLWIEREGFADSFVGDADPAEARVMAATQNPLNIASFTDKSGPPTWKKIPSWYLVSANDRMIPPPAEEAMAKRMGATTASIPASHASMVSHPVEVADFILSATK